MKKITILIVAILTVFYVGTATPSNSAPYIFLDHIERKTPTEAIYIAMLFHRLSGHDLDFETWAQDTDLYKAASEDEKLKVQNTQVDKLKSIYYDINPDDPIVVELDTKISALDKEKLGFRVEGFLPDLFFNFHHMDNNYAAVPLNVTKYTWYKPDAASVKHLKEKGMVFSSETPVDVQLVMTPKAADGREPVDFGVRKHWLLSAQIEEIQVWTKDGRILWQIQRTTTQDKLINLYQK